MFLRRFVVLVLYLGVGVPLSFQMNFTSGLAFKEDFVPLIESSIEAEGAKLDLGITDFVVLADILVHHMNSQVIAYILYIDVKGFIPFGLLACLLLYSGPEFLFSNLDDAVGVHLVEKVCVTGKFCFNHGQFKGSRSVTFRNLLL